MKKKDSRKQVKELIVNMIKTINLYRRMRPKFMLFMVFIVSGLALVPLLSSYVNGQLINNIVAYIGDSESIATSTIFILLMVSISLGFLIELFYKVSDYLDRAIRYDMNEEMAVLMTKKLAELDLEKLEDPHMNTLLSKVRDGYDHKVARFATLTMWLLNDLIQLIATVLIILSLSPIIIPIILVGLIPEFFVRAKGSRARWGIWDAKGEVNKKYWEVKEQMTKDRSIKEIRILGAKSYLLNMMRELLKEFLDEQRGLLKKETYQSVGAKFIEMAIFGGIEFWLLLRVLATRIGVGDYTFYLRIIERFGTSSRNLLRNMNQMYELNLFMTDLYTVLDTPNKIFSKPGAIMLPVSKMPKIEFKHVSFTYPNESHPVFQDFSMTINPGEDIALVGENGAGKTTFVKLLCRFYDIDDGQILIDGNDIRDLDLEAWHKHLGVLFQDFNRYAMTAKENIMLGNPGVKDEARMVEASKMAGAHGFISKLKNQYDHIISKWFFQGTDISGGEWQRIALARSFYRDANILILDEPTSAIDPKGEYEIFKKISETQQEKTTIIISHRFSTVRNADHIYVIDDGKILEHGSHEALISHKDGTYKQMFEMQAEGYR